ncbi:hypothetical protein LINGRAHAP2_LOCUS27535 [Linum grandiflorum]
MLIFYWHASSELNITHGRSLFRQNSITTGVSLGGVFGRPKVSFQALEFNWGLKMRQP